MSCQTGWARAGPCKQPGADFGPDSRRPRRLRVCGRPQPGMSQGGRECACCRSSLPPPRPAAAPAAAARRPPLRPRLPRYPLFTVFAAAIGTVTYCSYRALAHNPSVA